MAEEKVYNLTKETYYKEDDPLSIFYKCPACNKVAINDACRLPINFCSNCGVRVAETDFTITENNNLAMWELTIPQIQDNQPAKI